MVASFGAGHMLLRIIQVSMILLHGIPWEVRLSRLDELVRSSNKNVELIAVGRGKLRVGSWGRNKGSFSNLKKNAITYGAPY